ncbi:MAG: alpha/beta hydrolase [Proteobacteria bacterium]|nr:alpha/beta hydrolase [Pseudomonadota bacterium]
MVAQKRDDAGSTVRVRDVLRRPDAEIYYEVTGHGPPLIFAHGLGGNHLSWWQQIPHFSDRYTCVTFAHRGFTPSREAPGGPGVAAFADDLGALIDHLGFREVGLVAQSMGGWTCLGYALRHPGRVRDLVMASTSGAVDFRRIARFKTELDAWSARADAARAEYESGGVHPAAGARMAREQPSLHFLYREIDDLTPRAVKDRIRPQLMNQRTQPPDVLGRLTMKVLFITGDEDMVFPSGAGGVLAAATPDSRHECVPQAGHSTYFERPETFNRLVDSFLSDVKAVSGQSPQKRS